MRACMVSCLQCRPYIPLIDTSTSQRRRPSSTRKCLFDGLPPSELDHVVIDRHRLIIQSIVVITANHPSHLKITRKTMLVTDKENGEGERERKNQRERARERE